MNREPRAMRPILVWAPILAIVAVGIYAFVLAPSHACPAPSTGTSCQTPTAALAPSPLVGVVVSVDTPSLGKVNGFDLRLEDGTVVSLKVGVLENPTQFSPSHLSEHEATSEPVRAFYRVVNGVPTVYRLEDATASAT